ncbi:Trm112 family protein [Solicola gregarius]|uniref:Trm112 family protein n=1 Tax=Solicola gregarius TaxID=2908642 RepID=A0AA46TMP1_9ACTN|nr:Trm112 family protein [Solicola gregarius]UYM07880.1 Trm112 family protein [Solicola gregarius]
MNLDASLLEILVCPVCRSRLAVDEEASALVCAACPQTYEVRDGIPVLTVADDAPNS